MSGAIEVTAPRPMVAVVDDDAVCRRLVELVLKRGGYDVRTFESGDAFVADVSGLSYACVVLDLSMPGLNGLDVQFLLNERGTPTPVIFLSAEADPHTAAAVIRNGAADMIQKPVDPDTLVEKVREVVTLARLAA